jgi:hypothetical protein
MKQLNKLLRRIWFLDTYGLREKNLAYVKDEESNLNSMIITLNQLWIVRH